MTSVTEVSRPADPVPGRVRPRRAVDHGAWFLVLPALPVTPTGKVDRRALSQLRATAERTDDHVEPRDTLELRLAQLWKEVLGVARIGVRDNFFELGGHSLLAVKLMARVRQEIGRNLPLAALFAGGTVEVKDRRSGARTEVPVGDAVTHLLEVVRG